MNIGRIVKVDFAPEGVNHGEMILAIAAPACEVFAGRVLWTQNDSAADAVSVNARHRRPLSSGMREKIIEFLSTAPNGATIHEIGDALSLKSRQIACCISHNRSYFRNESGLWFAV